MDPKRNRMVIHGGGNDKSRKLVPDPYANRQGWLHTRGCIRRQNENVVDLVDSIHQLNEAGDINGTLVVYGGTASAEADPFNHKVRTDPRYFSPAMAASYGAAH